MSRWRVSRDMGEWFVSEVSDYFGGVGTFATEAAAVEELRRIQVCEVESEETDVAMANQRLRKALQALKDPPKVTRMSRPPGPPRPPVADPGPIEPNHTFAGPDPVSPPKRSGAK